MGKGLLSPKFNWLKAKALEKGSEPRLNSLDQNPAGLKTAIQLNKTLLI